MDAPAGEDPIWKCTECGARNTGNGTECRTCEEPRKGAAVSGSPPASLPARSAKPPSHAQGEARPGDWPCGGCGNMNWAKREKCHQCGMLKPSATRAARTGVAGGFAEIQGRATSRKVEDDGDDSDEYDDFGRKKKKFRGAVVSASILGGSDDAILGGVPSKSASRESVADRSDDRRGGYDRAYHDDRRRDGPAPPQRHADGRFHDDRKDRDRDDRRARDIHSVDRDRDYDRDRPRESDRSRDYGRRKYDDLHSNPAYSDRRASDGRPREYGSRDLHERERCDRYDRDRDRERRDDRRDRY